MSVHAARKLNIIIVAIMVIAGVCAYLIPASIDRQAADDLRKVQSLKMKDNTILEERVEKILPGGQWHGGEFGVSYKVKSKVLLWEVEGNRVLAASKYTIHLFPELTPKIDKSVLDLFGEYQGFRPFLQEQYNPIKHPDETKRN